MNFNSKYNFVDYKDNLKTSINFVKNKEIPFHKWYPFVEGFSEDFIINILAEVNFDEVRCLEPFSGCGTTPLTMQSHNVNCYSFEVNPFMQLLTRTKLRTDYTPRGFNIAMETIKKAIEEAKLSTERVIQPPAMTSMLRGTTQRNKWLFHDSSMDGILDLKYAISTVSQKRYRDLFTIVLASILLEVSNVYRNGKCVSYKKDWQNKILSREQVHDLYLKKIQNVRPDLDLLFEKKKNQGHLYSNYKYCFYGDVREKIDICPNNHFNLVITSPPYLNSRDYTDTYMVELWLLDLVKSYEQVRCLRQKTIRSHVQVKWEKENILNIDILKKTVKDILDHKESFWNNSIPEMIVGYFNDMDILFGKLNSKLIKDGLIYFNVANSAYYGVDVPTDIIVAAIAEKNGFHINEIRIARHIAPSSQQKDQIRSLRESVLVMRKL